MNYKNLRYIITSHSKYSDGTEHSFICRITPDLEFAEKLMQSIYDDAANHRVTRAGTYSDPVWKDKNRILEVKNTISTIVTTETFYLVREWEENYLSDKEWILE